MVILPVLIAVALSQGPAVDPHARHGVHGMVLMGTSDHAYLSHIPMFRRPHDVQLIAQVRLRHPDWTSPQDFSEALHTFVPARFDLTQLMSGAIQTLEGAVHRGNFEADGPLLKAGVKVEVIRLLRATPLTGTAVPRAYFLFGTPERTFAAHLIGAPPSFDQLLVVRSKGLTAERLARGIELPVSRVARVGHPLVSKGATITVVRELSRLEGPEFVPSP